MMNCCFQSNNSRERLEITSNKNVRRLYRLKVVETETNSNTYQYVIDFYLAYAKDTRSNTDFSPSYSDKFHRSNRNLKD